MNLKAFFSARHSRILIFQKPHSATCTVRPSRSYAGSVRESAYLASHHQAAAEHSKGRLDLVEARGVAAIEQARHLRGLPAEPFGKLVLVSPAARIAR